MIRLKEEYTNIEFVLREKEAQIDDFSVQTLSELTGNGTHFLFMPIVPEIILSAQVFGVHGH